MMKFLCLTFLAGVTYFSSFSSFGAIIQVSGNLKASNGSVNCDSNTKLGFEIVVQRCLDSTTKQVEVVCYDKNSTEPRRHCNDNQIKPVNHTRILSTLPNINMGHTFSLGNEENNPFAQHQLYFVNTTVSLNEIKLSFLSINNSLSQLLYQKVQDCFDGLLTEKVNYVSIDTQSDSVTCTFIRNISTRR